MFNCRYFTAASETVSRSAGRTPSAAGRPAPAERESVIGVNTHFGEVLGEHSDIDEVLEEKDLKILSEDQEKISWLLELTGSTVSGINPLDYHEDDEDDEDD